jgi:hypothetical protein
MTRITAWLTAMLIVTSIAVVEGQPSLPKWDLAAYRQDPARHVAILKAHLTTRIPHTESARRYAIDLRTDIERVSRGDRDRSSKLSEIGTVIASLTGSADVDRRLVATLEKPLPPVQLEKLVQVIWTSLPEDDALLAKQAQLLHETRKALPSR